MIETDAHRLQAASLRRPSTHSPLMGDLAVGRVTKGVASALGKSLTVDREAALPDQLASLVERLKDGPLGQQNLTSRRVA